MTIPFIEAPTVYVTSSMSNSIDTTGFDEFRQGVELTLDKYFYQGSMVKIHSGEPDHQIPQVVFGQFNEERNVSQTTFTDITDGYSFLNKIVSQSNISIDSSVVWGPAKVQPGKLLDGIIEPLTIRATVDFSSVDSPFESHDFKGNLESGNFNRVAKADLVVDHFEFTGSFIGAPFIDNVRTIYSMSIDDPEYSTNARLLKPYADEQVKSGVIVGALTTGSLLSASLSMSPATDNYCPKGTKRTTAGFSWKTLGGIGVDSIAFGGKVFTRNR